MKTRWWARLWGACKPVPREKHLPLTEEQSLALALSSAALGIQNEIQRSLRDYYIDDREFLGFMPEFYCYMLHLLDREVSGTIPAKDHSSIGHRLIPELAQEQRMLAGAWFAPCGTYEEELQALKAHFQERQLEYGSFGQDWREKVTARFAGCAVEALGVSEDVQQEVARKCCALAADAFAQLSPRLLRFAASARNNSD